jgi:hypothetical protein
MFPKIIPAQPWKVKAGAEILMVTAAYRRISQHIMSRMCFEVMTHDESVQRDAAGSSNGILFTRIAAGTGNMLLSSRRTTAAAFVSSDPSGYHTGIYR